MSRLFIAEKPELGRAIAQTLGSDQCEEGYIRCSGGDVVTWCFGHLLELTDPEDHDPNTKKWDLNSLPLRWPVQHKPIGDKSKQVKLIKKLASEASEIVHAGDPDEEGQLLVDEVLDYINNRKPVKRVLINDLNEKVVRKSLNNLKDNREFYGLYQSALARSVSDQLYGYNLTRAYTLAGQAAGASKVLSVGRVQTPILGLVVRRDRANESHEAHFYFEKHQLLFL
ncbi:MAG: toprim domain-containing protein [Endozoicomonas sp.]